MIRSSVSAIKWPNWTRYGTAYTTIGSESVIFVSGAKEYCQKKNPENYFQHKIYAICQQSNEPENICPILFVAQAVSTKPASACDTHNSCHDVRSQIRKPEMETNLIKVFKRTRKRWRRWENGYIRQLNLEI